MEIEYLNIVSIISENIGSAIRLFVGEKFGGWPANKIPPKIQGCFVNNSPVFSAIRYNCMTLLILIPQFSLQLIIDLR